MSTIASKSVIQRSSFLRLSLVSGVILGLLHLIIQDWLVFSVLGKTSLVVVMQYVASGAIGTSAFAGGFATALLGLVFHFLICVVVAAVFILGYEQIPLLRRYSLIGSLLYGLGVFVVMYFLVIPLSAAPPVPVQTMQIIEIALEHVLVIGLPLGLIARRSMDPNR